MERENETNEVEAYDSPNRRRLRAKLRFKALVRLVIANLYWLEADIHVRTSNLHISEKRTGRHILSLKEFAILKKSPEFRTHEEVNLIWNVIGYLSCFRMYPEDVKRALVAHTMFEYYPPNRVLVRQGAKSHAMYFIISGKVEITATRYIEEIHDDIRTTHTYLMAGDGFGDFALLHDTPRLATVKTVAHCELLVLKKYYFDLILRALTLDRTTEIENAMDFLPQFEHFDRYHRKEICVLGQIAKIKKGEIVLGDGYGKPAFVHFLLKGKCKLVEELPIKRVVTSTGAIKEEFYTVEEQQANTTLPKSKEGKSVVSLMSNIKSMRSEYNSNISSLGIANKSEWSNSTRMSEQHFTTKEKRVSFYPENVRVIFMDICLMHPKTVFNLGENLIRRRIVAATDVTCLRIPAYYLLPQSTIWSVIRDYMNKTVPGQEAVFKIYQEEKKFRRWKKSYIHGLLGARRFRACNNIHNVPYSIRCQHDYNYLRM